MDAAAGKQNNAWFQKLFNIKPKKQVATVRRLT